MRKLSALGMALMIGGGLFAGAAPAQAQEIQCSGLITPVCAAAARQVQHVLEEAGHAYNAAYMYYEWTDATIRCVVFQECY